MGKTDWSKGIREMESNVGKPRELSMYQKAFLWDRLKTFVKDIVTEDEMIYFADYQNLVETLESDEVGY